MSGSSVEHGSPQVIVQVVIDDDLPSGKLTETMENHNF